MSANKKKSFKSKESTTETTEGKDIEETASTITTKNNDNDSVLFPVPAGKTKPDYGTNNTLELLERIPSQVVDLKLDEVVTAVNAVDNMCDYPKCKTRVSLMGQDCGLCKKRFCFKHGQPEVHGCAEAAKKHERELFLHPKTGKTIRQEKELAQAKKRLNAKLKDMQIERMAKTSAKDNQDANKSSASNGGGSGIRKKKN